MQIKYCQCVNTSLTQQAERELLLPSKQKGNKVNHHASLARTANPSTPSLGH
jgi:hypothetical protein